MDVKFLQGSGAAAAFPALRQAMADMGWTEVRTYTNASGPDVVFRGKELYPGAGNGPIIRFSANTTANSFNGYGYSDLDTSTGTGANAASTNVFFTFGAYWLLAVTGVSVFMLTGTSLTVQSAHTYWGHLRRLLGPDTYGCTRASTALASGATSIPTTSSMVGKLRVGQRLTVVNRSGNSASANFSRVAFVTLNAVSASALTVSALPGAFDVGALVGDNVYPLAMGEPLGSGSNPAANLRLPWSFAGTRPSGSGGEGGSMFPSYPHYGSSPDSPGGDYANGFYTAYSPGGAGSSNEGFRGAFYSVEPIPDNRTAGEYVVDGPDTFLCTGGSLVVGPIGYAPPGGATVLKFKASFLPALRNLDSLTPVEVPAPVIPATAVQPVRFEAPEVAPPVDIGLDISTFPSLDDTLTPRGDMAMLGQALLRRLSTPRGTLAFAPDYGTDVRQWLGEGLSLAQLQQIGDEVEAECLKDERIGGATVRAAYAEGELRLQVALSTSAGPYALTLRVDSLTIEALGGG
jgi:phage baseplate assembly protein W